MGKKSFKQDEIKGYAASLAIVAAATVLGLAVRPFLNIVNIELLYFLVVVVSATSWGLGPSISSSILAVVLFDALFVPPYGLVSIGAPQDLLTLGVFLIIAILVGELGSRVRQQVQVARAREQETAALYEFSRAIAFTHDRTVILNAAIRQIRALLGVEPLLVLSAAFPRAHENALLPSNFGSESPDAPPELYSNLPVSRDELAQARRVMVREGVTGVTRVAQGTIFLPLNTAQGSFGALGIRVGIPAPPLTRDHIRVLEAFAGQIALALERLALSQEAEQARVLESSERFRSALMSSLSHDLRTPLASILGSVTGLRDPGARLSREAHDDLLLTIQEEAVRLHRLVSNLLDMTRLEAGALQPQRDWHSTAELIDAALSHVDTGARPLHLDLDPGLPLVLFDFVLMEQVMVNLIENACKFSPPRAPLEITARAADGNLSVSVMDRGVGIPVPDLERVFEQFYRVPRHNGMSGSGLGLLICKGIVEAHGGRIWAEGRVHGGTRITFTLPVEPVPALSLEGVKADE